MTIPFREGERRVSGNGRQKYRARSEARHSRETVRRRKKRCVHIGSLWFFLPLWPARLIGKAVLQFSRGLSDLTCIENTPRRPRRPCAHDAKTTPSAASCRSSSPARFPKKAASHTPLSIIATSPTSASFNTARRFILSFTSLPRSYCAENNATPVAGTVSCRYRFVWKKTGPGFHNHANLLPGPRLQPGNPSAINSSRGNSISLPHHAQAATTM
jgi:hypothetical protein